MAALAALSIAEFCPGCGDRFTGRYDITMSRPVPLVGDVMVCMDCGHVSVFVNGALGLCLRTPEPAERDALIADEGTGLSYALATFQIGRWRR